MFKNFDYRNVGFKKDDQEDWLVATGEITNKSGRNYNAIVFRLILFIKSIPIGNAMITINGFHNGQTKRFEKRVGELEYRRVNEQITHYEIYPEGAY